MGTCVCQIFENEYDFCPPKLRSSDNSPAALKRSIVTSGSPSSSPRNSLFVSLSKENFVLRRSATLTTNYFLDKVIGEGAFGVVHSAVHLATGQIRAIKTIRVSRTSQSTINSEIRILQSLDHPNILNIYEVIEDECSVHIVSDLCTGGSLYSKLLSRKRIPEDEALGYFRQLISGVVYLHSKQIIHRDLKIENILFEQDTLKLIDFGISSYFTGRPLSKVIGTVSYMAPDVIGRNYNEKCDVWSCGVILYVLISGHFPFESPHRPSLVNHISKGTFTFQHSVWRGVSKAARDLIKLMLAKDPAKRYSAAEVLAHPWLSSCTSPLAARTLVREVLARMSRFHASQKFRLTVLYYVVHHLLPPKEVAGPQRVFLHLNRKGDGRISASELKVAFEGAFGRTAGLMEIFDHCDLGHSGFIEYSEFLVGTVDWKRVFSKEMGRKAFQAFDVDGDGQISLEDFTRAVGVSASEVFKANSNGHIKYHEFYQLVYNY